MTKILHELKPRKPEEGRTPRLSPQKVCVDLSDPRALIVDMVSVANGPRVWVDWRWGEWVIIVHRDDGDPIARVTLPHNLNAPVKVEAAGDAIDHVLL